MLRDKMAHWVAPWKWAPLIVLLAHNVSFEVISFTGYYLLIPVAMHLAYRYRKAGCIVVALAGLFMVGSYSYGGVGSTPATGVYLAALIICWWLQPSKSARHRLPDLRLSRWVYLGFLLLPLRVGLGSSELFGDIEVDWIIDLYPLLFLLVFSLGLSLVPRRPVLIALAAAAILGTLLEYAALPYTADDLLDADRAELPWYGLVDLSALFIQYRFDTTADFFTALGFLLFGRFLAEQRHAVTAMMPSPLVRGLLLIAAIMLALGGEFNQHVLMLLFDLNSSPALEWIGNFHAIFLASLLAGVYFRKAGIVALLFAVIFFWWLDGVLRGDLAHPKIIYRLDCAFYVYGFGLLGVCLRDSLEGKHTNLWSSIWLRYLVVYMLMLIALIPVDNPYDPLLIALFFVSGIAIALWLSFIHQRLLPTEIVVTGGWLSLVTLLMIGYMIFAFGETAWQTIEPTFVQVINLTQLIAIQGESIDEETILWLSFLAAALYITAWMLTSTLESLIKSSNQLLLDIRSALYRLRHQIPLKIKFGSNEAVESGNANHKILSSPLGILKWTNRVLLGFAVIVPLVLVGHHSWHNYQKDLAWEQRYREIELSQPIMERNHEYKKAHKELIEQLTDAALSVVAPFPNVTSHATDYDLTITTGWMSEPGKPNIRRRLDVTINPAMRFREMPLQEAVRRSLWVRSYRQEEGRFGLWVERSIDDGGEDETAYADAIEKAIETTAIGSTQD